jgi:hypothetical protein
MLLNLLMSSISFSQTLYIIEGDTNVCFTPDKAKFILKQGLGYWQCVEETFVQQAIIQAQEDGMKKLQHIHNNDSLIIDKQKDIIQFCEGENTNLMKQKQKMENRNKVNKTLRNIFLATTIVLISYEIARREF